MSHDGDERSTLEDQIWLQSNLGVHGKNIQK